jgi:hypothetical protein
MMNNESQITVDSSMMQELLDQIGYPIISLDGHSILNASNGGCQMKGYKEPQSTVYRGAKIGLLLVLLIFMLSACNPVSDAATLESATETTPVETDSSFTSLYPTPESEELEACLEMGGKWDVLGKVGPGCNLPTEDGGKVCHDSEQCESLCLATTDEVMKEDAEARVPDPERIEQLNSQEDQISGTCSNWQRNFGCRVVVKEGKYLEICID